MDLNFIGIGGAFNSELGNNCAYIKEKRKILFIDFGLDTFEKVIRYKLLNGIDEIYVLITHLHGDHVGGLPTFIQYINFEFNKKIKIINNSQKFTNDLKNLLKITGVHDNIYGFINVNELPFSFNVELKLTTHTPLLECYSIIFNEKKGKTLYTSDSNDINYLKQVVNNPSFIKIYTEAGVNSSVHTDYSEIKKIDYKKLILMHIETKCLYEQILKDGYKIPDYLK